MRTILAGVGVGEYELWKRRWRLSPSERDAFPPSSHARGNPPEGSPSPPSFLNLRSRSPAMCYDRKVPFTQCLHALARALVSHEDK
mmetsp:Transcript_16235/g.49414  ORF Transcript_16235/g.49414 Transcript_16235/m.49414 type:complete len:86 (-) Transcript_16235:234-491(-)|eukprot:scaffold85228_cov26-Tisochrysis_lutea.AAC.2